MASNAFGQCFRMTTWGESHGPAIGVVLDGVPAGLSLSESLINEALEKRQGGKTPFTTPRKEPDRAQILSGIFEGQTTGTPISILIPNQNVDSSKYDALKDIYRPGHAHFTYEKKYGVFDYRGGGRASARETACRVAAGAVADQLLAKYGIETCAYLQQVGPISTPDTLALRFSELKTKQSMDPIFCPHAETSAQMQDAIESAKAAQDSYGGTVRCISSALPVGLGDPVYEKLEANLAKAMMSLPASKGFAIGHGFFASQMQGSTHNDSFTTRDGQVCLASNHSGGTLGGISTGEALQLDVAFKPTASIMQAQQSVDVQGQTTSYQYPSGSRHDPCVAIRAVPVVKAMVSIVLADALLMSRLNHV